MIGESVQVVAGVTVAMWAGRRANAHGPGTSWLDRIVVSLIGAAGLLAVLAVPLSRLPVIVDARAEVVSHQPGQARVHVYGTKTGGHGASVCEFLAVDAYIIAAGRLHESPMQAESDPRPGNTRPAGRHDFGIWRVQYAPELHADAVLFRARHRCAWWVPVTDSDLGPFALPPARPAVESSGEGGR